MKFLSRAAEGTEHRRRRKDPRFTKLYRGCVLEEAEPRVTPSGAICMGAVSSCD